MVRMNPALLEPPVTSVESSSIGSGEWDVLRVAVDLQESKTSLDS